MNPLALLLVFVSTYLFKMKVINHHDVFLRSFSIVPVKGCHVLAGLKLVPWIYLKYTLGACLA
tara:strand:+ start:5 stop:193 length:189 start_codon:yes stop_codon:yes gene_type:complete